MPHSGGRIVVDFQRLAGIRQCLQLTYSKQPPVLWHCPRVADVGKWFCGQFVGRCLFFC